MNGGSHASFFVLQWMIWCKNWWKMHVPCMSRFLGLYKLSGDRVSLEPPLEKLYTWMKTCCICNWASESFIRSQRNAFTCGLSRHEGAAFVQGNSSSCFLLLSWIGWRTDCDLTSDPTKIHPTCGSLVFDSLMRSFLWHFITRGLRNPADACWIASMKLTCNVSCPHGINLHRCDQFFWDCLDQPPDETTSKIPADRQLHQDCGGCFWLIHPLSSVWQFFLIARCAVLLPETESSGCVRSKRSTCTQPQNFLSGNLQDQAANKCIITWYPLWGRTFSSLHRLVSPWKGKRHGVLGHWLQAACILSMEFSISLKQKMKSSLDTGHGCISEILRETNANAGCNAVLH